MDDGAFGDNGGYNHTVELCPLMSDEGDQRHGECGTFAYVQTYEVKGQVWKNRVTKSGDGFSGVGMAGVPGTTVTLTAEPGENLAADVGDASGDNESYSASSTDAAPKGGTNDERIHFNWDQKAAGVYTLGIPDNWVAKMGEIKTDVALPDDNAFDPLEADLQIDVTPTTGYIYGVVTDALGFSVADVDVTVNDDVMVTTDAVGRYIAEGFSAQTRGPANNRVTGVWVETDHPGSQPTTSELPRICREHARGEAAGHSSLLARRIPPRSKVPSELVAPGNRV